MKDYPFVKCLHPQSIVNPYTNERLLVECGKCKACRVRKGSIASMKCKLESLSHKYSNFITTTYANNFVPLMKFIPSQKFNEPDVFVEMTPRLDVGVCLVKGTYLDSVVDKIRVKTNHPSGYLPHLSKRDAQLFIKRLRRNIEKRFPNESIKVRYYLVGELGPVHFRPHLHLILWHDSDELQEVLAEIVSESWRFGRIDVETSKGQCADYVAKYVNGSCSLPRIYQEKETKPFALHSNHLGEMVLQKDKEEIYKLPAKEIVSRSVPLGSTITDVNLWRSLKTAYFPRCKKYSLRSESERLYAYLTYPKSCRYFGTESITELTHHILSEVKEAHVVYETFDVNPFDEDDILRDLVNYFTDSCNINTHDLETDESYLKYFRKVYMELRLSKHFFGFCCDWDASKITSVFKKIEAFWQDVDYLNLTNQYEQMEKFCHDWYSDEEDLQFFYVNVSHDVDNLRTKPYYRNFHMYVEDSFNKSVKHKKLNDMNDIFKDI